MERISSDAGVSVYWQMRKNKQALQEKYRLVQAAPRKGSIILYLSDMLYAGPNIKSDKPWYFITLNIARDDISHDHWHDGFSSHQFLVDKPKNFGDLLDIPLQPRSIPQV